MAHYNIQRLPVELLRTAYKGKDLTAVELDILKRLARGDTLREAAARLDKSPETLKRQMKVARAKLDARTNTQAVAIAISLDMI